MSEQLLYFVLKWNVYVHNANCEYKENDRIKFINPTKEFVISISGIENQEKKSVIFKQTSEKYPDLTITATYELDPNVKLNGKAKFVLKNGKYID